MLTAEMLDKLFDKLESEYFTEPLTFTVSPTMHKRLFIMNRLSRSFQEPPRKLRKVQMRRITTRRKVMRYRAKKAYDARYKLSFNIGGIDVRRNQPISIITD